MSASERVIVVVHNEPSAAEKLKELIEFMDAPNVRLARPANWFATIGERRLAAVFLSDDLDDDQVHQVFADVGRHDPNVPIVVIGGEAEHA